VQGEAGLGALRRMTRDDRASTVGVAALWGILGSLGLPDTHGAAAAAVFWELVRARLAVRVWTREGEGANVRGATWVMGVEGVLRRTAPRAAGQAWRYDDLNPDRQFPAE